MCKTPNHGFSAFRVTGHNLIEAVQYSRSTVENERELGLVINTRWSSHTHPLFFTTGPPDSHIRKLHRDRREMNLNGHI